VFSLPLFSESYLRCLPSTYNQYINRQTYSKTYSFFSSFALFLSVFRNFWIGRRVRDQAVVAQVLRNPLNLKNPRIKTWRTNPTNKHIWLTVGANHAPPAFLTATIAGAELNICSI
jgi:hypothetical protein